MKHKKAYYRQGGFRIWKKSYWVDFGCILGQGIYIWMSQIHPLNGLGDIDTFSLPWEENFSQFFSMNWTVLHRFQFSSAMKGELTLMWLALYGAFLPIDGSYSHTFSPSHILATVVQFVQIRTPGPKIHQKSTQYTLPIPMSCLTAHIPPPSIHSL
jgi:hypothetical protein